MGLDDQEKDSFFLFNLIDCRVVYSALGILEKEIYWRVFASCIGLTIRGGLFKAVKQAGGRDGHQQGYPV